MFEFESTEAPDAVWFVRVIVARTLFGIHFSVEELKGNVT